MAPEQQQAHYNESGAIMPGFTNSSGKKGLSYANILKMSEEAASQGSKNTGSGVPNVQPDDSISNV